MSVASFEARLSAEGHADSKQSCTECAQTFLTGSLEIYVKIQKKQLQQDSYLKREKNKTEDGLIWLLKYYYFLNTYKSTF